MDKFIVSMPRAGSTKKSVSRPKSTCMASKVTTSKPKSISQQGGGQMFLDFGQKSFGANKTCGLCGMFYVIGDVEDERAHTQFCSDKKNGPILPTVRGHRILETINEEGDIFCEKTALIIDVKRDQKLHKETIQTTLLLVQKDLGSSSDFINETDIIYLYVQGRYVVGCIVLEEVKVNKLVPLSLSCTSTDAMISNRYGDDACTEKDTVKDVEPALKKIKLSSSSSTTTTTTAKMSSSPSISSIFSDPSENLENVHNNPLTQTSIHPPPPPFPESNITMGVRQIWVHEKYRRRGIAMRLVDVARKYFVFGTFLQRHQIAFSQPTTDGLQFALAYTKASQIWGY